MIKFNGVAKEIKINGGIGNCNDLECEIDLDGFDTSDLLEAIGIDAIVEHMQDGVLDKIGVDECREHFEVLGE